MFNFQPSPELLKQMLGGMPNAMPPVSNIGKPMPMQGIDVGMNAMPPIQHPMPPMNTSPMGVPPISGPIPANGSAPTRKPVMTNKPNPKSINIGNSSRGMMQNYNSKRAY